MLRYALITFSIFLLFSFQHAEAQYVSYGAKLGLSFPGFQDEEIASQRITPAISATGSFVFSKRFLIQTEIGYDRKGNKYTYQVWDDQGELIEDSVYNVKTNLDYITIPLFARFNLSGRNQFYFQAGGYYGYLLRGRFTGKMNSKMVEKVNIRPGLSPHDFGLLVGGGIDTPVRTGLSVMLDLKYHYGLKDLIIDLGTAGQNSPLKNKGLIMSMGMRVDIL